MLMGTIVGVGYLAFKAIMAQTASQAFPEMSWTSPLPSGNYILNPSGTPGRIVIPGLPSTASPQVSQNCVSVGTGGMWCS